MWGDEPAEEILRPLVAKLFSVADHPTAGRLDATLVKAELTLAYSDNEVLGECRSSTCITIDEFEIECQPTPSIINGQRVVIFELQVTDQPIRSTVNGEENELPF